MMFDNYTLIACFLGMAAVGAFFGYAYALVRFILPLQRELAILTKEHAELGEKARGIRAENVRLYEEGRIK